jgi:TatD DNase family protein
LFDKKLISQLDYILSELKKQNCLGIVCVLESEDDCSLFLKHYNDFPFLYCSIGTHPHNAKNFDFKKQIELYERLKLTKRLVAIGEIGLDFYYNFSEKNQQIKCFETQLTFAKENFLPVIIHSRQSNNIVIDILKTYQINNGVFHCFNGNVIELEKIVELNFKIGITGIITFKKNLLSKIVAVTKEDYLVVETDSPYLTPEPFRGKINSPLYLKYIVSEVAKIRTTNSSLMESILDTNSKNLFNL